VRRLFLAVAGVIALGAAAPLQGPWKHWRYSRPIDLPPPSAERFVDVPVVPSVYARARKGLEDLRLIDEEGREVPYVLRVRHGETRRTWVSARLFEVSFLPGGYTQAFVDAPEGAGLHNLIRIGTGGEDFFAYVELAVSDDAKTWRVLRERAPIYRFRSEGLDGNQVITYSDSRSPHLRLRVLEKEKAFALDAAEVAHEEKEDPERVRLPAALVPESGAERGQSWWCADAGAGSSPVSEVRFEVAQPEFHRPVRVSVSDDRKTWRTAGCGQIYRIAGEKQTQGCLKVSFPESQGRFVRVAVYNRDDPPLAGLRLSLYGTPRHLVFRREPGRRYRLLYGNSRERAPDYEIARIARRSDLDAAARGALGSEEANAAWEDPNPWTERHPWLLWAAAGIAVFVLGTLAIRALRS
jgi:hypothetical protein